MVLDGYDHDDEEGLDIWRIRNSWGEKGYFRVSKGKRTFGINQNDSLVSFE